MQPDPPIKHGYAGFSPLWMAVCLLSTAGSLFLGDKPNNTVIGAILLNGENQEKLRKISLLFDLHGQVKNPIISREFKRIVAIFPHNQLFWCLEGIVSANTIF